MFPILCKMDFYDYYFKLSFDFILLLYIFVDNKNIPYYTQNWSDKVCES